LDLLVFQGLFQTWHKISRVPHIRGWAGGWTGWAVGQGCPSDTMGPAVVPRDGVGGGPRLPFRHNGTSRCAKGAASGLQTTLQGKAGRPIMVMDDWEQFRTNATLLKPTKYCHSLIRALQGHEKAVWKSRPGYL